MACPCGCNALTTVSNTCYILLHFLTQPHRREPFVAEKYAHLTLRVEHDLSDRLKEIAQAEDRSVGSVVRRVLRDAVARFDRAGSPLDR